MTEENVTNAEEEARLQGWVPEEEWDPDRGRWVEAEEFLFRGELMGKIHKQGQSLRSATSQINDLREALKTLGDHNKRLAEQEYKKAMKSLRSQQREAIQEEDFDAADNIEEEMDRLKEVKTEVLETPVVKDPEPEVPEEVSAWVERNRWYETDQSMQAVANTVGTQYRQTHPNASIEEFLKHVETRVREEFPHKFGSPAPQEKPTPVSGNKGTPRSKVKKYTVNDLSEDQRGIAKTFVRSGAFESEQEYVDQLAEMGEIPAQR